MKRSTIAFVFLFAVACSIAILIPGAPSTAGEAGSGATATSRRLGGPDWPQWRGPGRDAVSPQTGLVRAWPESGPDVAWRVKVGPGFSSVSIAEGRLYTLWDEGDRQFLVSLDAATGKEHWRRELGAAFTHPYGDGPRSTPLVDENLVYAIGTDGLLLAADRRTGEPKWRHDLVNDYRASLPSYGFSTSPLVVDDKLAIEAGGVDATWIAFNKKTGAIVWTAANDTPAYSSPIAIAVDGVSQIVFWSAHGLHAVATDDGTRLWDYSWETFCPVTGDPLNTASPIFIAPDRIFISSGAGAAALRIAKTGMEKSGTAKPDHTESGNAAASSTPGAASPFTVETLWKSEQMRSDVNTSLLLDDHIYGFDRGTLKSLDAATGEVTWKARGFGRGSLIAADGTLFVLGEAGNLALVDATPDAFVQRASAQILAGRNWTAPSLAGGRLYLRNHEELVCIDLTNSAPGGRVAGAGD